MTTTLKPSEVVSPTDGEIYACWKDINHALRNVMRGHPIEVVRWLAEYANNNEAVVEAAEDHLDYEADRQRVADASYDIAEANQRQSDFFQGYEDARDGKPCRSDVSEAYVRGWRAGRRPQSYSDASHGE
jgi:hypothetical protein